jgi:tRNA nucleotidyltransferase/poly(A) polymerase
MKELDPAVQQRNLSLYAGRWIASIGDQIIGQGGTPSQALHAAQASRFKEIPLITYIPPAQPLQIHPILEDIAAHFEADFPVYIVGGAVRDALLGYPVRELDFILPKRAIYHARRLADHLDAPFYVLDRERDYGRILVAGTGDAPLVLDFAPLQGRDLDEDLKNRDFTINAMAVGILPPYERFDPLGGAEDLRNKKLRACSPTAISDDPIRTLRGVRFSINYKLRAEQDTKRQMRSDAASLLDISPERLRDELFKIFTKRKPHAAIQVLERLGALKYVLPELLSLRGVEQSTPHIDDVWTHTLKVVKNLELILDALRPGYDPDATSNLFMGVITQRLGRYREQIADHLLHELVQSRSTKSLLVFAAFYHDSGKVDTQAVDADGKISFLNHEMESAQYAVQRAGQLQMSNEEIKRVRTIIRNHMRPLWLAQTGAPPSRRAKYRFFRDTQAAGVDICLLALADTLGTYGHTLTPQIWQGQVDVVRSLLEAWWELNEQEVSPPALVNGKDLMREFDLKPGPLLGRLLEGIREAQATGSVNNQRQAYEYACQLIEQIENEHQENE